MVTFEGIGTNSMIFGTCKPHTTRSGVMQILSKFYHNERYRFPSPTIGLRYRKITHILLISHLHYSMWQFPWLRVFTSTIIQRPYSYTRYKLLGTWLYSHAIDKLKTIDIELQSYPAIILLTTYIHSINISKLLLLAISMLIFSRHVGIRVHELELEQFTLPLNCYN